MDNSLPNTEIKRRPGGRAEQMVAKVHQVTFELLQTKGYDDIEIPEIAKLAEVNKTSIYRRWSTKLELVMDVALAQLKTDVPLPDTGNIHDDLYQLLVSIAKTLEQPFVQNLFKAWLGYRDDTTQHAKQNFWKTRFLLAEPMVLRAIERGELVATTQARDFLEVAVAPLFYYTLALNIPNTDADIHKAMQRTLMIFSKK